MGNPELGKRIEIRRKQLNLTLDDVASEIGVAKSTIQRYEKGLIDKIKLPVIEAIARVLDVDPAWICCKTDEMQTKNEPTLVSESGPLENIVKLAGRDGSYMEKRVSDEQLTLLQSMLDQMKPVDDDSI